MGWNHISLMVKTWLTALGTWPTHQNMATFLWISWWGILCKVWHISSSTRQAVNKRTAIAHLVSSIASNCQCVKGPRDTNSFLRGLLSAGLHPLTLGLEVYVDLKFQVDLPLLQFQHFLLLLFHLGRWGAGPHRQYLQGEAICPSRPPGQFQVVGPLSSLFLDGRTYPPESNGFLLILPDLKTTLISKLVFG